MTEVPSDLMSPRAAARLLGIHHATAYRMIHDGRLRAWRRGGTVFRVSRTDVLALLEPYQPAPPLTAHRDHGDPAQSEGHRRACEQLRAAGYRF